ncbi:hypothetical protein Misp05_31160 [Micromonospora sp. NBRC 107095]|nr:hypothetical protein Misp05_31160 [Micromonospora sp. NBRC 107095]
MVVVVLVCPNIRASLRKVPRPDRETGRARGRATHRAGKWVMTGMPAGDTASTQRNQAVAASDVPAP